MTECKRLAIKALRLEREGKQAKAAEIWKSASNNAETRDAYELCNARYEQSNYAASFPELCSAANSDKRV